MDPLELAQIGTTKLKVTRLGMGSAPLGGLPPDTAKANSDAIVHKGYELGIRYFDTAPLYVSGRSERYFASGFTGVDRDSFILSTKVGRILDPIAGETDEVFSDMPRLQPVFDFSRDGVLRSIEESLKRLEMDRIDIVLIHDPDDHHEQAINEAFPTLAELRSQGVIGAIGAGMNQWEAETQFAREGDFDCFLLAGRYTLLDQSGLPEFLPLCEEKNISVILGGPYNSGILASDLSDSATFNYLPAPKHLLDKARSIRDVCNRHDVPLKAAALQFGLAHPAIAATIPGARSPEEVEENLALIKHSIPSDLWEELRHEGLIDKASPSP